MTTSRINSPKDKLKKLTFLDLNQEEDRKDHKKSSLESLDETQAQFDTLL